MDILRKTGGWMTACDIQAQLSTHSVTYILFTLRNLQKQNLLYRQKIANEFYFSIADTSTDWRIYEEKIKAMQRQELIEHCAQRAHERNRQ